MKHSKIWAAITAAALTFLLPCDKGFSAEKATIATRAAATQQVTFNIYLPLQNRAALEQLLTDLHDPNSASYRKWLTPAEFNARFAADPKTMAAVQRELAAKGLTATVTSVHSLAVTGTVDAVEAAFGTVLKNGTFKNGKQTLVAVDPINLLPEMGRAGASIVGLSGMIRMTPHSVKIPNPSNRYSPYGGYFFDDLKQAYEYPSYTALNGAGVTIGILMTGSYNQPDMDTYFGHEKLPSPHFSQILVNGGAPFNPNGGSFETHLDLQQSGGMAPKANIVLYNTPDLSDSNLLTALIQILTDNKTDVVSMSFGGPEVFYTAAYNNGTDYTSILREYDDLFSQGNAQGITFVASSGDSGALSAPALNCLFTTSLPGCGTFQASVESPASSPHVTGVGGTNLTTTYAGNVLDRNSQYVSEQAFADPLAVDIFYGTPATGGYWGSGGGDSVVYKKPTYQHRVATGNPRFRTVPDVALHMGGCPGGTISCNADDSFDWEVIAGQYVGVIGTSASAPDFAGLTALAIERFGTRLGNENYYIYALAAAQHAIPSLNIFHNSVPGFNGLYNSYRNSYDRVLGNGTLNGINFLLAPDMPKAGIPQTPTNP